jgi:hypothetical protein
MGHGHSIHMISRPHMVAYQLRPTVLLTKWQELKNHETQTPLRGTESALRHKDSLL